MTREKWCKEKCAGLEELTMVNKKIVLPFDEDTYDELLDKKETGACSGWGGSEENKKNHNENDRTKI